jgi:type II secretory pathway pseudopilin PulG
MPMSKNPPDRAAFSLVEVTLAIGLVAFALVALVGLLSSTLRTGTESTEEMQAANVASRILGERRAAPLASQPDIVLPPLNDAQKSPVVNDPGDTNVGYRGTEYLTREGDLAASEAERTYRLDYRIARDKRGRLATVFVSLVTPWQSSPAELASTSQAVQRTRFECVSYMPVPST